MRFHSFAGPEVPAELTVKANEDKLTGPLAEERVIDIDLTDPAVEDAQGDVARRTRRSSARLRTRWPPATSSGDLKRRMEEWEEEQERLRQLVELVHHGVRAPRRPRAPVVAAFYRRVVRLDVVAAAVGEAHLAPPRVLALIQPVSEGHSVGTYA